jgi:hypothetical protein
MRHRITVSVSRISRLTTERGTVIPTPGLISTSASEAKTMTSTSISAPRAHTISRRSLLKAAPAAAVILAAPAVAMSDPDAAILAAWERREAAYTRYNALPIHEGPGDYSPEEQAEWAIIDAAEDVIRNTVATTPQGAAIQLWTQLSHNVSQRDDEVATLRRDLSYFEAQGDMLDWTERLTVAALRSLASMEGA